MSIINSDGLNTNWQLNVLRGLQAIADEVAKPLTCAEDGITICSPATGLDVNIYGFDGATPTPVSVDSNGFVNTNTSITFPSALAVTQDPASDPWTVDASDLDIRNLLFATDKVDVSGSSVKIQDGLGNNLTSTPIGTDVALDVNIVGGVTLDVNLNKNNDTVQVYGSDLTAPIATDTAGHLQVDILTIPEVEIKNDAGNPIPVNGTVAATQSGTWNINNITGTVSLPTGAATQTTLASVLTAVQPITTIAPNILSVTGSGSIAVAVYSITFFNNGPDDELISFDGGTNFVIIGPGVSITMDAGGINNKYPAGVFHYDVIGTGPIIITYNS